MSIQPGLMFSVYFVLVILRSLSRSQRRLATARHKHQYCGRQGTLTPGQTVARKFAPSGSHRSPTFRGTRLSCPKWRIPVSLGRPAGNPSPTSVPSAGEVGRPAGPRRCPQRGSTRLADSKNIAMGMNSEVIRPRRVAICEIALLTCRAVYSRLGISVDVIVQLICDLLELLSRQTTHVAATMRHICAYA